MHTHQLVPLKDSIATQLLKAVFALYLVLVVTVTLLHLLSVYVQTKASVLQELEVIGATFKPGLEQALWEINLTQMHSITTGIVQLPAIVGVRVEDDQGSIIQQIGSVLTQQGKMIEVNGEGTQELETPTATLFGHEFPLFYTRGNQEFLVGNVSIYSSSAVVFQRIRFGFLLLMIAAVIQIIAFWILFLWISRTKLSRPLAELTYAARQLDLDNLENIKVQVHTSGRNELKILEETFNVMIQKLLDARTTLYEYANELHQSRQQLQDILDNTPAVVFIKDTEGRYLLINRQYESLFHISKAEITGKTDYEVFPKEMADVFRNNDQQVINAKRPLEVEEYAPHDDGIHTYLSVKFPLRDEAGRMYAVCGIASDISKRKEAEERIRKLNQELEQRVQERTARLSDINALLKESERRLKEAQRIAQLGNWVWNIQTNELFWSDEIYRIFGLHPQEFDATYEAFLYTVHPEDRDFVQHSVNESLYNGKLYSIDHQIVQPDGTVRVVHEQGEVKFDEQHEPIRMLGTVQDITERKQMENDLRHAKDAAEAASRAKSTFLANMSHELRTPLHGILGFAQQLERDATLTDSQHQSVDIIYRNGKHLLTLLNDILDFTKIEANTLELHPEQFALPSLIRQLADMAQLNAKHKGLSFAYEAHDTIPHIVYGDQKRLRQILLNLLGNAIRFTEQGKVIFRVTKLENRDSKLETGNWKLAQDHFQFPVSGFQFQIEDTGIGIPSDQLETIFQPFQQADPYKLQEGSTGLGLAISQRLVKMMGSQIHVISIEGQGTTFWFELELPVVEMLMPQRSPESLSPPEKKGEIDEPIPPLSALLPADWIATLRQAAEESDIEVLFEVIARIREREPGLADALARLVEDFEYDEILRLIQSSV